MIEAEVRGHRPLKAGCFLLRVKPLEEVSPPRPGQFAMLRAWEGFDPLLARPFSIHDYEEGFLEFLIQVRGRGTKLLATLTTGERLRILAPLGQGFPEPKEERVYLVAGGVGIAPFFLAAKYLLEKGIKPILLYGARSKGELVRLSAFRRLGLPLRLATEDGSLGRKGLVTDLLEEALKEEGGEVWACGPLPMLSAVAEVGKTYRSRVFLSLEARMACGLGLCLGCVVKRAKGSYLHVCVEGPVVPAEVVF